MLNYMSEDIDMIEKSKVKIDKINDAVLVTVRGDLPDGWHQDTFESKTKVAKDSGGFQFLGQPELAETFDVDELIHNHKRIGFGRHDTIMSADFPIPTGVDMDKNEVIRRQMISVEWYDRMQSQIRQTIPVLHGQTVQEILNHKDMYGLNSEKMVAVGSNLSQSTVPVMGRMKNGKLRGQKASVIPRNVIWQRIFEIMPDLDRQEVFLLGAGGMNAAPLAALLGAKSVDATSWRLNAKMFAIYDTTHGRFIRCGSKNGNNIMNQRHQEFLSMRLKDEDYPFYGMSLKDFTKVLQLEGAKATEIRGIHNAWELKKDNEVYNEYEGDPEGLAKMLEKRWTSTNWTDHQNLKLLNKAKECIKSSTRELEVYIN